MSTPSPKPSRGRISYLPHATIRLGPHHWYIRSRWLWAVIAAGRTLSHHLFHKGA